MFYMLLYHCTQSRKKKEKKDSSSLHNSTTIDIANNQLLSQNIEHKGRP